ncbi:MAG: LamG domain-containing protein [Sedimentisphaerales bacterium]|nr:LamG domain-containing protein [Sedimentisphaerales bacterium]
MCRKLCFFTSLIFMLVLVLTNAAKAELIGWWTFDEGSGDTAFDLSDYGNDGILRGDPQWVDGIYGGAVNLDGDDDYIEINSIADDLTDNNFTVSAWIKTTAGEGNVIGANDSGSGHQFIFGVTGSGTLLVEAASTINSYPPVINDGQWHFIAYVRDGTTAYAYTDGELVGTETPDGNPAGQVRWSIGMEWDDAPSDEFTGQVDDVHFFNHPLTHDEIIRVMEGKSFTLASRPEPANGAFIYDTLARLSWKPGGLAASHYIYFGENFNDVNEGASDTFRGNQADEFYAVGVSGSPYPDGLVPGTTYYWRIDEVNESEPNSPWKGDVWSFTVPPKTAYAPNPANEAEFIKLNMRLSWAGGFDAKLHYVVFGDDFDEVSNAAEGTLSGTTTYNPGPLKVAKTYYWRIDEFNGTETYKGDVWSFTTIGAVSGPNPADGAVDVKPSVILTWDAGSVAISHEVYFGTDADAVKDATKASPEYKGPKTLRNESYDPDKLMLNTAYFWRIDEVNDFSPDSPWAGKVWSFTTGNFIVIDDFESYNSEDKQIWISWYDGIGFGGPGVEPYFEGNHSGAIVGDEDTYSYTEETIVHGGKQSMPYFYDNNKQGFSNYSEAELTLDYPRDWTQQGVDKLIIWFRGDSNNDAEPLYIAVSNSTGEPAIFIHDNPAPTKIEVWTEWVISLQELADQGIDLFDVDRIAIGIGTKGNVAIPGGSGKIYFDDIRLYRSEIDVTE